MNKIEQMKARLATILAELDKFKGVENYAQEDVEKVNTLSEEFTALQAQIQTAEKIEALTASAAATTRKVAPAATTPVVEVQASRQEKMGGFKSTGEYLVAVKNAARGNIDKRFQNAMFEKSGEDGGFLVPEEMLSTVSKKLQADESLLSKTKQFVVSGNNLTLPVDEKAPWNGGIVAYWMAEGSQFTESKTPFTQASFKLNKLGALVKVSEELLEDATALESYITAMAPEAIMHKVNEAIISGNGVGKPVGILNSGFKVQVAAEGAQVAGTVVAKNVLKMFSRMIPAARANAVWYINPMVEEQLRVMKDDLGNFIYLAPGSQMNASPYGQLLGRPVLPLLGGMPQLGDVGDIIFADLSYMYSIMKSGGMKQAVSSHLLFDYDQQAYKFILRVDASCPFKSPVSPQYGNYEMSGFVTLAAR